MGQNSSSGQRRNLVWIIGGIIVAVLGALASVVTISGYVQNLSHGSSTPTPSPVPTATATLDCPQGVVTTIRDPNPPPSRLDIKTKLRGHQNGGGSPTLTTYVEIDIRCDGDTVQFNHGEMLDCNGASLRFDNRLGGGVYIGDIPPLTSGGSYVCEYKQTTGQVFRYTIASMPQPKISAPADGASVPIPRSAPLVVQFAPGGSSNYITSARASDSVGDIAVTDDCGDGATCQIAATKFNTPYPTPPAGFPTPSPGSPTGVFIPGSGNILVSRLYASDTFPIIGTAFHRATLDYEEISSVSVTWTQS